jgi:putative proteasome-type protease
LLADRDTKVTYCLGILTKDGLVLASDSRTNAGADQVSTCRKMYTFVRPGQRAIVVLTSGSLSLTQSVITLLRKDFDAGQGLAAAETMYEAARVVGVQVRAVADLDRASLERDAYQFNIHLILGGQILGQAPALFMIYPQGNPLQATEEMPYLQIGETKYGRPILDRGILYDHTSLEEAVKYALLSIDSTMKSNVTVGPPIDVLVYPKDELALSRHRRFDVDDADFNRLRARWQQALRQAVARLPGVRFALPGESGGGVTIELVDGFESGTSQQDQSPRRKTRIRQTEG